MRNICCVAFALGPFYSRLRYHLLRTNLPRDDGYLHSMRQCEDNEKEVDPQR